DREKSCYQNSCAKRRGGYTTDGRRQIAKISFRNPAGAGSLFPIKSDRILNYCQDVLKSRRQRIGCPDSPKAENVSQRLSAAKRHMDTSAHRNAVGKPFGNAVGISRKQIRSIDANYNVCDANLLDLTK